MKTSYPNIRNSPSDNKLREKLKSVGIKKLEKSLSKRLFNALNNEYDRQYEELNAYSISLRTEAELLRIKNLGKKSLHELILFLSKNYKIKLGYFRNDVADSLYKIPPRIADVRLENEFYTTINKHEYLPYPSEHCYDIADIRKSARGQETPSLSTTNDWLLVIGNLPGGARILIDGKPIERSRVSVAIDEEKEDWSKT